MSKEVDQRIVEMQFNNADFEQKVSKSLTSLRNLKEASKMEDAGKGLDNLTKSIKGVDFSAMAKGIEQLNERFSNLGIVGITIMQRLTNAAIDAGAKIGEAITAAPRDGWKEYELNLDSVKTILNSAKGADGLPVTLDKVNEKLAELNEYSDKTIYSFSDMTNNIGKFTNAGVDLDSAVTAIQGVANVAALSGANANDAARAMYNFGQALGSGSVKLIDWKSIENANMATIGFKEQLIQTATELGVLRQEGDKYISTTTDMSGKVSDAFNATQGFNDSLSAQWMTSEVLTKTLAKYTDTTTDLGQAAFEAATKVTSFSKLVDTLKESMGSGWMQTFQIIFGDFEEASKLWTGVYERIDRVIQKVAGLRNAFFQSWKDSGGRDALINSIKNIWDTVEYYVGLISKAFEIVFPTIDTTPIVSVEKGLESITEKFKPIEDATEKVKEVTEETSAAVQEVVDHTEKFNGLVERIKKGDFGNGEERVRRLQEAGYAYENLQNAVNKTLGVEEKYETAVSDRVAVGYEDIDVTEQVTEANQGHVASLEDINEATKDLNPVTANLVKILLAVKSTTGLVKKGFGALWGAIGKGASVGQVVIGGLKFILNIFGTIAGRVYQLTSWLGKLKSIGAFFTGLRNGANEMAQSFGELGINVTSIAPFLTKIENIITDLIAKFKEFIAPLKSFEPSGAFDILLNVLKNIAMVVGGVLFVSLNALAGVLSTVIDYASLAWDTFKNLTIIQTLADHFRNFKEQLKGYKDQIKEAGVYTEIFVPWVTRLNETFENLKSLFGPIFQRAFDTFILWMINAGHAIESFINAAKQTQAYQTFINMFQKFQLTLKDIPATIAKVIESLQKTGKLPALTELPNSFQFFVTAFNRFKEVISGNFATLFQDIITKIATGLDGFGKVNFGPFQGFVDKIKGMFDTLKKFVFEGEGTVGELITKVWGKLSQIDWRGGAITALIGAVALFAARWSKVGKSAADAMKGLGEFFRNGGKAAQTVDKFSGFVKIAAGIAIIAASIWLISTIPADEFKRSVATIGIAFVAMFATIELLAKQKIPEEKMKAIGEAFAGFGASFLLIAAAAKIFATMDPTALAKAGVALAAFTIGMSAAAIATKDVGEGAGKAFVGIAAALLMLIPAINLYADMDTHTLVKGGAAIAAFMFLMAGASKVAGNGGENFGKMAQGLTLITFSIKRMADMDVGTLVKGGVAIYAFLMMMASASKKAGEGGGKSFIGMAIAIGVITVSLKVLSTIPWPALMTASLSLRAVLKSLTEALTSVSEISWGGIIKSIVALGVVLGLVAGALYLMTTKMDVDKTLKAALGVSSIMLAFALMGPSIKLLSRIPFQEGVVAAGNAMVFFGAMVLCLGALGEIATLGDGAAGAAIENGAGVFGRIIHNFLDGLMNGSEDPAEQADKTVTLADKLSAFGDSIQGFLTTLQDTDYEVVDKAKALATAILTIAAADLLDAIAGWVRGKADLDGFSNSIVPLTQAVVDMNSKLEGVNLDSGKIQTVIDVVNSMSELAKSLPKKGGWAQKILGVQELSTFAKDMTDFLSGEKGFAMFAGALTAIGPLLNFGLITKMSILQNATSTMIKLANALPENGAISRFIDGPKDLGEFAKNMTSFMTGEGGFTAFVNAVNGMTSGINLETLRGNIVPATEEMIKLGTKLKEGTGVLDFIIGRTDLGKFGERLAAFGTGIASFASSIVNVQIDHIDGMTAAMERLATLNASEQLKTSNLGTFSSCINGLGVAIAQFFTDTSASDPTLLGNIIGQITNLHNMLLVIAGSDYSGIDNFSAALEKLGQTGAQSFIDSFTESASKASEAATAFVNGFLTTIDGLKKEFEKRGATAVLDFCVGINSNQGFLEGAGKSFVTKIGKGVDSKKDETQKIGGRVVLEFCVGVNKNDGLLAGAGRHIVDKAIGGIKDNIDKFYDQGEYSAAGYARGIRDNAADAAEEAARMVRDAAQAAADAQRSASPSKVYMGLGKDGIDGYILGFVNNTSRVVKAVRSVGKAGISAMQSTIEKTLSLIDGNLDYTPTITPVMDLSQLTNGVDQANYLLSNIHTDDLAASAAASIANAHNATLVRAAASQSMDYTRVLAELLENTNRINNSVRENRYAVIDGDSAFRYFDRRLGMA